jgi:NAD(P)-dependent dehydrogenase (short-subunit alcohol dehydrogenase family)
VSTLSAKRAGRRFENKVVLITGTGGGQGRTAAVRFAEEGAIVVGADIKSEGFAETVAMVEAVGGTMTGSGNLDLTVAGDVRDWVEQAVSDHGGIDVVYNNAGAFRTGDIATLSLEDWSWSIDRELNQVFSVTHAAWPHLVGRGGGSILNTASIAGIVTLGEGGGIAHSATKAAVIAITRDMATSGAQYGIRANSISPGTVETPATAAMFADPQGRAAMMGPQLIKRLGQSDDIVSAALYLSSDEASFVTGVNLVVDGGYTVR